MGYRIATGLEGLGFDGLNLSFAGLGISIPCTAGGAGDADGGIPVSCCHILERLSAWNRFLWHVGLQLRELTAPGELSLVRVVHWGSGGLQQEVRSRDARFLFYLLLVRHCCVVSVHLDEVICEGSGLGEYREQVVSALQQNTSLRALTLGGLFGDYRCIREDMFKAMATMTNLRELGISGTGAMPSDLLDAICPLLVDTMSLTTLSLPGLVFGAEDGRRLLDALRHNDTIANLSLHGSIVHSYLPNGVSRFSRFLSTSIRLCSLSVDGVHSDAANTYNELACMTTALVVCGMLSKLKLAGFLLNADCASLFASLVSRKGGLLAHLDISGCHWRAELWPRVGARQMHLEQPGPAFYKPICPWLQGFDSTRVELSFLALSFAGLTPEDLGALLNTAATVESLGTISVSNVSMCELKEVCQVIRESGTSDRVRIEGEYIVDSAVLNMLQEFPERLRHVVISSFSEPRPEAFGNAVQLACSWYQLTTLRLLLTQSVLSDVATVRLLSECLSTTTGLTELELSGCYKTDLSRSLRAADNTHSVLLEAIFDNPGVRVLQITGFRLGRANLWFLADEVVTSETLCEVSFASCDIFENETFLQFLAADFRENKLILRLQVLESVDEETRDERFVLEDLLSRNIGYVTCAAHFIVNRVHLARCAEAYATVSHSAALNEKIQQLTSVKDAEAKSMIRSILE
ncbi:hypothetical protein HPB49_007215 [Dermacentor silvarum]|uniref:Uncharacterized protein n=1 Tax=Dermacentor silvarum TaxID=543639 RepID=A0ACB8DWR8_DERSI|nr:uncharacterized protein LOC125942385 [Dermacentor silvarum]KAH7978877.1 hypothetical protein HPB49_007215 [Dermacentor silvarum]